jgi:hypothetical protein
MFFKVFMIKEQNIEKREFERDVCIYLMMMMKRVRGG